MSEVKLSAADQAWEEERAWTEELVRVTKVLDELGRKTLPFTVHAIKGKNEKTGALCWGRMTGFGSPIRVTLYTSGPEGDLPGVAEDLKASRHFPNYFIQFRMYPHTKDEIFPDTAFSMSGPESGSGQGEKP
jgi:hypothetical protein